MAAGDNAIIAPPPRASGNPQADTKSITDWLWSFFIAAVVESGLLDPSFQSDAGTFDPDSLPDPADSSIAKAQDTANRAYQRISLTEFSLSDTNDTVTFTFTVPRDNADYRVLVQPKANTGPPASAAFVVAAIDVTAESFTVQFASAPGSGTSITYDGFIIENP
jgi:hypothetical protein